MHNKKHKLILRIVYALGITYVLIGIFIREPEENPSIAYVVIGILILALILIGEFLIRKKNDTEKP